MKSFIKKMLQGMLGFDTYLYLFSIFTIRTLRWNRREGDFLHFLSLIQDGGAVLDIGANIGIMTVHLARKLPSSSIFAFEPMPVNVKALRRIIRHFRLNNVVIQECALGNKPGKLEMVMPVVNNVKMQGLSHMVHSSINTFNEGDNVTVTVKTLDEIVPEFKKAGPVTAIKMDVENFEFFVLEGGHALIQQYRPLIYTELWKNQNRDKCFEFILKLNYGIFVLENSKLIHFDPGKHNKQNFFFIPS